VHRSIRTNVPTKPGGANDDRYTAKVIARTLTSAGEPPLSSDLGWVRYPRPDASIPIIRNEELILLRAEANNALGNALPAANDINYIRATSGGLALDATLAGATQPARLDAIVQQRTYSLLYEGHRWFDMRRLGRLAQLPIDRTGDVVHASLPTPINEVLARQGTP
jgi:hypothetical protein